MKNNYFKIKIPLINKNYFKFKEEKKVYKYRGTAYILIEKKTGNIAFNTLILDNNQKIYGADDGRYGANYGIKNKKCEIFKYRQESFNHSIQEKGKKNISLFKGEISTLNKLILKCKLTIKDVDAFISGSNSSGGLKRPEADPVRIFYQKNDPIKNIFKIKSDSNIEWMFFSLISNIAGKFNNANFDEEITIKYLNDIEEKSIDYIFNELKWKFVPYKSSDCEELQIDFIDAFKAQNVENVKDFKDEVYSIATPEKWFKELEKIKYVMNLVDLGDKRYLEKEVRSIWQRIVENDISNNKYVKDFVRGLNSFDRAHIIENKVAKKILLNSNENDENKREFLKNLFNPNNYILLTKEIHSYWDKNKIKINEDGLIENNTLDENDFNKLTSENKDIFSIYKQVLNLDRKNLIEKRYFYDKY